MSTLENTTVLGSKVSIGDVCSISEKILDELCEDLGGYVCVANVHMVVTARTNPLLHSAIEDAYLVVTDGMPLVWEVRRKGYDHAERVAGPDLMCEVFLKAEQRRVPVYFYGGSSLVVDSIRKRLLVEYPNLIVAGFEAPPILPEVPRVDCGLVERLNSSGAKIVFVGLGCPKQELWMNAYASSVRAVLIGIGAGFDFYAGSVRRAPSWMQRSGLEWLYRLCVEPRRLWRRYLVTNSLFVWFWIKERFSSFLVLHR